MNFSTNINTIFEIHEPKNWKFWNFFFERRICLICMIKKTPLFFFEGLKMEYRIVASRSMCYYSENQRFCFLKTRLLSCRISFFRSKTFLFFKIESWNFQHLFEKEFISTQIRQWIEKMEIKIVWMRWMSWNFVRFHYPLFQTVAESFSFLSWKTKKFYY